MGKIGLIKTSCFLLLSVFCGCKTEVKPKHSELEATSRSSVLLITANLLTNIKSHDVIVLNKKTILKDENSKEILLPTLFLNRKKILFFYFSRNSCEMCLDKEMEKLKQIPNRYLDQVVILLSVDNVNQIKLYKERYKKGFRFFDIGNVVLSKKIDSLYIPYYFVADQNLNTSMLFIPDKNLNEPTKAYLKEVLNF